MSKLYKYQYAVIGSTSMWLDSTEYDRRGSFETMVDRRPVDAFVLYRVVPEDYPQGDSLMLHDIK